MTKKNEAIDAEIVEDGAIVLRPVSNIMFTDGVDLKALAKKYRKLPEIDLEAENLGDVYQEYLKGYRVTAKAFNLVEKMRKQVKDPVLQYGKKIDATAKELKAIIEPTRDRLLAGKKLIEDEEERKQQLVINAELDRQKRIDDFISNLNSLPMRAIGKSSSEIQALLNGIVSPTAVTCEERVTEAVAIWQNSQKALEGMLETAIKAENADKLQEEAEAKRVEYEAEAEAKRVAEREAFEKEKAEFEAEKRELAEAQAMKKAEEAEEEMLAKELGEVEQVVDNIEDVRTQVANDIRRHFMLGSIEAVIIAVMDNKIDNLRWSI